MGDVLRIRFDNGPEGKPVAFAAPMREIIAHEASEVVPALAALDRARSEGHWVAGFATYEMGYALEPRMLGQMPDGRRMPLMHFGVFKAPDGVSHARQAPDDDLDVPTGGTVSGLSPHWSFDQYAKAFAKAHDYIGAGDIYQANLTFPLEARTDAPPEVLYDALAARQAVGFGAFVEVDGLPAILCRSPELFFRTDARRADRDPPHERHAAAR